MYILMRVDMSWSPAEHGFETLDLGLQLRSATIGITEVDQRRGVLIRERHMQTDVELRRRCGTVHRIRRCWHVDHEARAGQYAALVQFQNPPVDPDTGAEIVSIHDQILHRHSPALYTNGYRQRRLCCKLRGCPETNV